MYTILTIFRLEIIGSKNWELKIANIKKTENFFALF